MNLKTNQLILDFPKIFGGGYKGYLNFKGRYRVNKGSRASKKSANTAQDFIIRLMETPDSNLLVVRKVYRTMQDSAYAQLKWALNKLGLMHLWSCKTSPLEITYRATGQKILFRGLDDPLKITSITVETGYLCWLWIEEAYEVLNEADFDMVDESIRGAMPEHLYKQATLTLNPWNERHWIKARFFDKQSEDIFAITTNYKCNEWLDAADLKLFESMRVNNPRRYQVAGLGNWGVVSGLVFENWEERNFSLQDIKMIPQIKSAFGLDFGYTNDPSALFCGLIDLKGKVLYVFDEMYKHGMSNEKIAEEITVMGYAKERIRGESAEPKSIDRLYDLGIRRITSAKKGKDSVNNGIDFIQDFKIVIHPQCVNFLTEISNYTWQEDRFGKKINKPLDDFNHLMDAMRYGLEEYSTASAVSFGE